MDKPITITTLELENVKRIKALHMAPSERGLTVIGGANGQGKTSVLDGILAALGGGKHIPSALTRDGAMNPARMKVELSNGITVERKGKNATLTVTDSAGRKSGQSLLDAFLSEIALNLPKFMQANPREKALIILRSLGIDNELKALDEQEKRIYDDRTATGRIADAKKKYASELPEYPDAPEEPISAMELIVQQQEIMLKNAENQKLRSQVGALEQRVANQVQLVTNLRQQMVDLQEKLTAATHQLSDLQQDHTAAQKSAEALEDESTAELEQTLSAIEATNHQVAINQAKAKAMDEAEMYAQQYAEMTAQIEGVRAKRMALFEQHPLPLPELGVEDLELTYKGQKWDCMSGAEKIKTAVAICRADKPSCGFVLLDGLEAMDVDTLQQFGAWAEGQGLQVIATRVSTGEECTLIIEDGLPAGSTFVDVVTGVKPNDNPWE